MQRRAFLVKSSLAVLGLICKPPAARGQANPSAGGARARTSGRTLPRELEDLLPKLMAEMSVPGLSIAVINDGRLVWHRGFGFKDAESKAPVDDQTVFEAASVSKTVFAYAVLKLHEKRLLDLDTPLTRYLPGRFLEGDPQLDLVTARHALSHSSGFQDWRSGREPLKIHFTPGTQFLYSGEGYYYLQSVVTQLTGQVDRKTCAQYEAGLEVCATDIDPYLKRHLLLPFGMFSSGYLWSELFQQHAASPHDISGKPLTKGKPTATNAARYASAGGLHTTAVDYARFLLEILQPKPSDEFRLEPQSLAEMLRPHVKLGPDQKIDGATAWALGWAIQEREGGNIIIHSGGQSGFRSLTMAAPGSKSGFVVLTNSDNGGKVLSHERFLGLMEQALAG